MSAYRIYKGQVTKLPAITFNEIRESIGGYVEPVYSADGATTLWCNEDGNPLGLSRNGLATAVWWHLNPAMRRQWLVGPVIVTGGNPDDVQPVPATVAEILDKWQNA